MPQFRKDPLSDRWVAFAEGRDQRPNEYEHNGHRRPGTRCPFCAGHEADTPVPLATYTHAGLSPSPHARDWLVRVVPNKYPAFDLEGEIAVVQDGLYEGGHAVGAHEVIVESPRHIASLTQLDDQELILLTRAYRDRLALRRREGKFRYALVFKNVGPQAGASLEHAHSQIVATPRVPREVACEMAAALQLYERHGACFFCRVIADECGHGRRLVAESRHFVAVCPYASRFPYEMWVLPRNHASHFEDQSESQLAELAYLLRSLVGKLETRHERLAYNYFIHTAPLDGSPVAHYHWHLEILPRLTTTAGFEWGAGYYINPVLPEQAAAILRGSEVGHRQETASFPTGKTS